MISRKHFQMIADALLAQKPEYRLDTWGANRPLRDQWEQDVKAVAGVLPRLNPRFDRDRFLKACGLEEAKEAA